MSSRRQIADSMDKLTLDANPADAPGCVKLTDDAGRSVLFQTDCDWPAVAGLFGWSTNHNMRDDQNAEACLGSQFTDGTVDCPQCGKKAGQFIAEARQYLDDHHGDKCDNPGYTLE